MSCKHNHIANAELNRKQTTAIKWFSQVENVCEWQQLCFQQRTM